MYLRMDQVKYAEDSLQNISLIVSYIASFIANLFAEELTQDGHQIVEELYVD